MGHTVSNHSLATLHQHRSAYHVAGKGCGLGYNTTGELGAKVWLPLTLDRSELIKLFIPGRTGSSSTIMMLGRRLKMTKDDKRLKALKGCSSEFSWDELPCQQSIDLHITSEQTICTPFVKYHTVCHAVLKSTLKFCVQLLSFAWGHHDCSWAGGGILQHKWLSAGVQSGCFVSNLCHLTL